MGVVKVLRGFFFQSISSIRYVLLLYLRGKVGREEGGEREGRKERERREKGGKEEGRGREGK